MKRSANIVLTLLVPAMTAFGCARAPMPNVQQGAVLDCDVPARPGEPEKQRCTPHTTGTHPHIPIQQPLRSSSHSWSSGTHIGGTGSTSSTVARGGFGGTGAHLSGGS